MLSLKNRLLLFIKSKIKLHNNKIVDIILDDIESLLSLSRLRGENIILLLQIRTQLQHIENLDFYKKCKTTQDRIDFIINNIDSKELSLKLLATQSDNKDNISTLSRALISKYHVSELFFHPQFYHYNLVYFLIPVILDNKEKTEEMLSDFEKYNDLLKSIILTYLPDSMKEERLGHIQDHQFKISVIKSFQDDRLKIKYIESESNDQYKYSLIHSLKDKKLKEKYLSSLPDFYKIKLLDDFDSSFSIEYVKNSDMDEKLKYVYYKNNDYQDLLLELVITGSDDIKKLYIKEIQKEKVTLSIFPLIKSNDIKCDLINELNLSYDAIIKLFDYIDDDENINLKNNSVLTDQDFLLLYEKLDSIRAKKNILPLIKEEPYEGFIYDKLQELILKLNDNQYEKSTLQINMLKDLYQLNKEFYINTNLNLFQENYFHKLITNKSFFFLLTKYPNYADLMMKIIDNKEVIYHNLDTIINLLYGSSKRIDNRLFKVMEGLYYDDNITSIKDTLLPSIIYNILKNPKLKLTKENSSCYEQQYNEFLDNHIRMETNLDTLKDLYFERYFKLSRDEAIKMIKQFQSDLDRLQVEDSQKKYINSIKFLKRILLSQNMDDLHKSVVGLDNITILESLSLEDTLKDIYIQNFKHSLLNFDNLPTISKTLYSVDFNAVEAPLSFNLLIHSTNAINKLDVVDHNYFKAWNENKNESNHTISCCHISNYQLRSASSKGVIFGFTTFENKDLLGMSFDDLGVQSSEQDLNVTKMVSHYCLNDTLDKNTFYYNEVILERNQITYDGISKLQPSCVVVFSTISEEDFTESLLAAEQFQIPILYIDRQKFLQLSISQEIPNIDTQDEVECRKNKEKYFDLLVRFDLPCSEDNIPSSLRRNFSQEFVKLKK